MYLSRKRVLIVDDNHHMRALVGAILRGLGCEHIDEATDGAEAFVYMRQSWVDAVIVDYKMNGLDGLEFVRLLRTAKDSPGRATPVLMLTGHASRATVLAAREAGVSAFVAKPVSTRLLAERLIYAFQHPLPKSNLDDDSYEI